jgi:hypothetical protein
MSRADELVVLIRNLPCSIFVLIGKFVKLMRKGGRSLGPSEDGSWLEGRATRMRSRRRIGWGWTTSRSFKPDIRLSGTKPDVTVAKFNATSSHLKRAGVLAINRLLVRCGEELIFFRDDREWVEGFVSKNRRYRIEPVSHKLPHGTGHLLVSTHRIFEQPEEETKTALTKVR